MDAHGLQQTLAKADLAAATLRSGSVIAKHQIITQILSRAILHDDRVELVLSDAGLADVLTIERNPLSGPLILSVAATRLRRGHQIRLVIEGEGQAPKTGSEHAAPKGLPVTAPPQRPQRQRDTKLIALLAEAHGARKLVHTYPNTSLTDLAKQQRTSSKHLTKLIELSCLAPDIVTAILADKQPLSLTASKLRSVELPMAWDQQRALLSEC